MLQRVKPYHTFFSVLENEALTNMKEELKTVKPAANTYLFPSQVRTAYNVPAPTRPSAGKKIVVITIIIAYRYPYLQSDMNAFCTYNNLPATTLEIFTMPGTKSIVGSGWDVEECIDTQLSYAMNTGAKIRVVEAVSNSFTDIYRAVQFANSISSSVPTNASNYSSFGPTDIISMSLGANEFSQETVYDAYMNVPTICYLAASGDTNYLCYPSSSANCLSCGGTSLSVASNGTRSSETTWSTAGCGISSYIPKPEYQNNTTISVLANKKRCAPDISAVANPYTGLVIVYRNIRYIYGGTSVATPILAGILSIAIQNRINLGKSSFTTVPNASNKPNLQSFLYKTLYPSNNTPSNNTYFYDVTSGSDGSFTAGSGYDIATGLGSLNATNLINRITNA
jgi:subtilase family serine protease